MSKTKKPAPPKSSSLLELELAGAKYVKPTKDGEYVAKKHKKQATHKLESTPISTVAVPLKRWPKPPKELTVPNPIGAQPDDKPGDRWHPEIPEGATYAAYQWTNGNLYMTPINSMEEVRDFRGGQILFGRLRYGEDFFIMSPEEQAGNVIRWKDGVTCFAEGKDPESLKAKARAAKAAAERLANPPAHVVEAFKAQVQKRKAAPGPRPGDIAGKIQNGVRKPGEGGKTARIWAICDALLKKLGRTPTKAEMWAEAVAGDKDTSPGMAGTNYSYWKRFYGHQ